MRRTTTADERRTLYDALNVLEEIEGEDGLTAAALENFLKDDAQERDARSTLRQMERGRA